MKKCKKRILFLFAFAIVLISLFHVGALAEENVTYIAENDGLSFMKNERLHVSKSLVNCSVSANNYRKAVIGAE